MQNCLKISCFYRSFLKYKNISEYIGLTLQLSDKIKLFHAMLKFYIKDDSINHVNNSITNNSVVRNLIAK